MRLVDDDKRGRFTALKEIVSLLGGMVFSFVVGMVMDACDANGNLQYMRAYLAIDSVAHSAGNAAAPYANVFKIVDAE